jgi:hypothetical protein
MSQRRPSRDQHFTEIPVESISAYGSDYLHSVLCALIVDPARAAETEYKYGTRLPHAFNDFVMVGGPRAVGMLLVTLKQWSESVSAERSMDEITAWEPRLAAWASLSSLRSIQTSIPSLPAVFDTAMESIEDYATGVADSMDSIGISVMSHQAQRFAGDTYDAPAAYACYAAADAIGGPASNGFRRSVVACIEASARISGGSRKDLLKMRDVFERYIIPNSFLHYPVKDAI